MLRRSMVKMLSFMGLFIVGLGYFKFQQISAAIAMGESQGPPPEAITTVTAQESSWPSLYEVVGSLEASQGVMVSAEDPGKVVRIAFDSGAQVKKGDVLVQLDTSVEEANLRAAEARLDLARKNLKRSQSLRSERANAETDLNAAEAEARQAAGEVDSIRAVIARKTIAAPFDGRAGIRKVNLGQYLLPSNEIVPLYALDPLFFSFSLPERYVHSAQLGQKFKIQTDAYPGEGFEGVITAVDPQVDPVTRNFKLQGTIPNSDGKLRPGMFARAEVSCGADEKVIPVPATSVAYAPYGNSLYIVQTMRDEKKGVDYLGVRQQFVKLGQSRGDLVSILEGLKPGEQVASSGVFKLRPGAQVTINNTVTPGDKLTPTVVDN